MNRTKKRKQGGSMAVAVKTCGKKTIQVCLSEFLQERGWERIDILGDGNCFFRAIAKYYEMSGNPYRPNHTELRQRVADFIQGKINEGNQNTIGVIGALSHNVDRAIHDIRTDKVWNVDIFEMVPPYMARALGVNIDIYDSRLYKNPVKKLWREVNGKKEFRMTDFQPTKIEVNHLPPDAPSATRINLLRVREGHYELLWPGMHNNSNNRKSNNNNNNNNNELRAVMAASLEQQFINNARVAEELEQLELRNKKPRKPQVGILPKSLTREEQEQANMNAAIKASMQQQFNNNARLAEELEQLELRNNKPNYNSNVSNASSVSSIGSFNGYSIENVQKDYPLNRKLTKNSLKKSLNAYGIRYGPKNTKEALYGAFVMAFKENVNRRTKNTFKKAKQAKKYANKVESRKASKK